MASLTTSAMRWLVVSPHFDDGVFSCGELLAQSPGSLVVTVFAGIPPRGFAAPPWDRRAGFTTADEAMRARRDEDSRALQLLAAQPVRLDFLDDQYGSPACVSDIAAQLANVIDAHPDYGVVGPAGLFHRDHMRVQCALFALMPPRAARERAWYYVEDAPYRRLDGLMDERIRDWRERGWVARRARIHDGGPEHRAVKAAAACAYASQTRLLDESMLADLREPEHYWRLECEIVSA